MGNVVGHLQGARRPMGVSPRPRETACIKCKQASALRKGVVTYQRQDKMECPPEIHQRQLPQVRGQQLPQGPGPEDYKDEPWEWRPGQQAGFQAAARTGWGRHWLSLPLALQDIFVYVCVLGSCGKNGGRVLISCVVCVVRFLSTCLHLSDTQYMSECKQNSCERCSTRWSLMYTLVHSDTEKHRTSPHTSSLNHTQNVQAYTCITPTLHLNVGCCAETKTEKDTFQLKRNGTLLALGNSRNPHETLDTYPQPSHKHSYLQLFLNTSIRISHRSYIPPIQHIVQYYQTHFAHTTKKHRFTNLYQSWQIKYSLSN